MDHTDDVDRHGGPRVGSRRGQARPWLIVTAMVAMVFASSPALSAVPAGAADVDDATLTRIHHEIEPSRDAEALEAKWRELAMASSEIAATGIEPLDSYPEALTRAFNQALDNHAADGLPAVEPALWRYEALTCQLRRFVRDEWPHMNHDLVRSDPPASLPTAGRVGLEDYERWLRSARLPCYRQADPRQSAEWSEASIFGEAERRLAMLADADLASQELLSETLDELRERFRETSALAWRCDTQERIEQTMERIRSDAADLQRRATDALAESSGTIDEYLAWNRDKEWKGDALDRAWQARLDSIAHDATDLGQARRSVERAKQLLAMLSRDFPPTIDAEGVIGDHLQHVLHRAREAAIEVQLGQVQWRTLNSDDDLEELAAGWQDDATEYEAFRRSLEEAGTWIVRFTTMIDHLYAPEEVDDSDVPWAAYFGGAGAAIARLNERVPGSPSLLVLIAPHFVLGDQILELPGQSFEALASKAQDCQAHPAVRIAAWRALSEPRLRVPHWPADLEQLRAEVRIQRQLEVDVRTMIPDEARRRALLDELRREARRRVAQVADVASDDDRQEVRRLGKVLGVDVNSGD